MSNHEQTLLPAPGGGGLPEPLPALAESSAPQPEPLKKVLSVMRGRWPWAIGLALGLGLAGAVGGYLFGRSILKYASSGTIQVISNPEKILYTVIENQPLLNYEMWVTTQVDFIRSNRIIRAATNLPDFQGIDTSSQPDAVTFVKEGLEVERHRGSELIYVTFKHTDPQVARRVAKCVIDAYMSLEGERELKVTNQRRAELTRFSRAEQDELKAIRTRRAEIVSEFATPDVTYVHQKRLDESIRLGSELEKLRVALITAGVNLQDLEARRKSGATGSGGAGATGEDGAPESDPASLTPEALAPHDPEMRKLVNERESLARSHEELVVNLGANHRDVRKIRELIRNNEQRIDQRLATLRESGVEVLPLSLDAVQSIEQLERRYIEVGNAHERVQAEVVKLYNAINALEDIQREEDASRQRLKDFQDQLAKLEVEQDRIRRVAVRGEPEVPSKPSPDRRPLLTAAGTMFGGAAGFGLVLLVGLMDRRLRSIQDAEESFAQTPMLGILPILPENLADPEQASLAAHCVHQIRTLLQIGPDSHGRRVFTITSPSPQAGKTSLSLSLGLSYAATGAKTLLIDCDLGFGGLTHRMNTIIRRRIGQVLIRERLVTAHQLEQAMHLARESDRRIGQTLIDLGYLSPEDLERALDIQEHGSIGLLDVIDGEPLENCVADAGSDNLHILPIGAAEPQHVARLSPAALRRLLDQARALFDVILVDTGSVLGSLEASHVAVESDGVVMVVTRGESQKVAAQALDHLRSIGARVAGLVFNRAMGHDVEVVAERSTGSMISRPTDNGHRPVQGQRPRMGPIAGAVASSSARSRR
jgi:polysaccharide biosynthesis transport protein